MLKIVFGGARAMVRGTKKEFKKKYVTCPFLLLLLAVNELKVQEDKCFIDSMMCLINHNDQ